MHTMPGLPILHSRDLVKRSLLTYAFAKLDLSPAFRLEGGKPPIPPDRGRAPR